MHRGAGSIGLALATAALAGAVGAAIGAQRGTAPVTELRARVEALGASLVAQTKAREALSIEVGRLRAQLDSMEARLGLGVTPVPASAAGSARAEPPAPAAPENPHAFVGPDQLGSARSLDLEALQAGGFSEGEAERLRERWEGAEMERLYLRDRATREGWIATPRFFEESRALDARMQGLRDEIGEDRYDWFLYASGQFNRVVVAAVLAGSPAREAGLQPGDALLRYGERRVFEPDELQRATTAGRAGESVRVELLREGERRTLTLPRGPIGINLYVDRARPEAAR